MYDLVFHHTKMSNQNIIDLLTTNQEKSEKRFDEISGQLVHHRQTMARIEKELSTRVHANTLQLNAALDIAASNTVKVDAAGNDIANIKGENLELKGEIKELKNSLKKVASSTPYAEAIGSKY